MDESEEELIKLALRDKSTTASADKAQHTDMVVTFCEETMGLCLESERELLGDWDGDGKVPRNFPAVNVPHDFL